VSTITWHSRVKHHPAQDTRITHHAAESGSFTSRPGLRPAKRRVSSLRCGPRRRYQRLLIELRHRPVRYLRRWTRPAAREVQRAERSSDARQWRACGTGLGKPGLPVFVVVLDRMESVVADVAEEVRLGNYLRDQRL